MQIVSAEVVGRARVAVGALALVSLVALPAAGRAQGEVEGQTPVLTEAVLPGSATRTSGAARGRGAHAPRERTVAPASYTAPTSEAELASDVGLMLDSRTRSGTWGAIVVSLTRGDTLYAINADQELQPASNMKLYTTALALDQFGADHQFSTDVLRAGNVDAEGTLHGDLILRGGGDPGLSSRYYQGGASAAMDVLAQLVADAGVKRVTGSIIADASAFGDELVPDGWLDRYLQSSYAARVSALSLNDNIVLVAVEPGQSGHAAIVSLEPASDIPVSSSVRTVAGKTGGRIIVRNTPRGTIEVRGWIGSRSATRRYQLVVETPALFTAGALRHALAERGVAVAGPVKLGGTPPGAHVVTSLASPPLDRLVSAMNRESINHYAELLFRDAGRAASHDGVGSARNANELLQRFMTEKVRAHPGSVLAADGSGLSVLDRVTPRSLVQLLSYAHEAPWSDAFHASLPVAGESELLRHRMQRTPAAGNLHAKTGTTNNIISLGGYVTARDGELLAFALIYNGTDRWRAREAIDQVGATLAGFTR
ncbi:MAG TPA: D-alanyl-D-alanine carboxypeptidase/D-alanyl-D-alanine-endopeptidase [Gemmatimonadaceae bacterium]|nr:D-alanyl-D-alanine carboxypeptidase/D-alanyl-D-alanine-endopeptidase [Gemmatimonadaceae bacterium]